MGGFCIKLEIPVDGFCMEPGILEEAGKMLEGVEELSADCWNEGGFGGHSPIS